MASPTHIAILGAGPGGYVAAIRAAQLGARVTVVEKGKLGGVCLNWGCIPSKALLSVVELGDKLKKADELGLVLQAPATYDLARMVSRKNKVVATLVKGIATLFKEWGIEHITGQGTLKTERIIAVTQPDGSVVDIEADALVIATGSSWPNLPQFPIDGRKILTSQQMLELTQIPVSLVIVGGGVEGCEFAALYSGLGTQVTVVELQSHVLPLEDEDISSTIERELKKRGVTVLTGTTVESFERSSDTVTVRFNDGSAVSVEKLLVSVGRGFNSRGIGLEQVGVRVGPRGEIQVDDRMETNKLGIYAIGDVTGKAMLAHVASTQGQVAVENILGHRRTINYDVIPAGIFTLPEIGRVGLTERQARERAQGSGKNPDQSVRVGRFRYGGLGKAQATGDTAGFFKVIAETTTDKILGVHILGAHAADLIHEATLAMQVGATVAQVAGMIHAHPTLAEGLMEAMEDVRGSAIHVIRKRAGG
ncbi:MAG: dihydrolipoyl dehydrogenase [Nitrospira sp.]